jgi:hypothetical protein
MRVRMESGFFVEELGDDGVFHLYFLQHMIEDGGVRFEL